MRYCLPVVQVVPWSDWVVARTFLLQQAAHKSDEQLEGVTTSSDGFLADKDSGGMFYVICLA